MPITAEELIRLVETDPELKRALQDRLVDAEAIQRALRDPEKRKEIRRAVLGEEWEDIPTILRQLAEGQQRHEAILQEHTQQLAMLIETQQRHEAILQHHTTILMHLEEEARALRQEFRGLLGRFEGEAYEKRTVRRAPSIFNGGGGGPPDSPRVQRRLRRWLRKVFGGIPSSAEEEDIYAADLIWWKDGHVVVAEISLKIDRLDVLRAKRRAQLLSQAGVNAIPVVIGNEWTMQETYDLAQSEGVEWIVGKKYSEKAMEFRKMAEADGDDEED
ncbi:MAG: hypothetical protein N2651_05705 [Fimbriimonadales bacterium]|nr:hypothetical protein [Fimbriimonadales bacterium]